MYNTRVQAIWKHKHIIFRYLRLLSTAVDSAVCHNIKRTVFLQSMIKRMKKKISGIWPNYSKKTVRKNVFCQISTELCKKCEKIQKMQK